MKRIGVVAIASMVLLLPSMFAASAQAHNSGDCGIATTSPADGATFTVGQQFTHIGLDVVDASAVLNVEVYVDTVLVGSREFDPFYLDYPAPTVQLPTSVAGTHTIDWKVDDTQLNTCVHSHTYQVVNPNDPDADDDGIYDSVDTDSVNPSDAFSDGSNFGMIANRNGFTVTVQDDTDPAEGFVITVSGAGTGKASFRMCGFSAILKLAPGTYLIGCGSVIVTVEGGEAEFDLGNGSTVTIPAGGSAEVSETGTDTFQVVNLGTTPIEIVVDGVTATIPAGETRTVTSWTFQGFTAPVDNPDVLNVLNAGQIVPLKWRLLGSDGSPVTDLSTASIHATSLNCADGTTADLVEELAAGASGLQNLGNGYYQLNWKSPKSYAKSCKTLHVDLGEGIARDAMFRFPK